jgi:hypothetical protein
MVEVLLAQVMCDRRGRKMVRACQVPRMVWYEIRMY